MTTFEQWNYGYGQRVILPSIKKGIINYEKAYHSSFDYAFAHHVQAIILCNNFSPKQLYFMVTGHGGGGFIPSDLYQVLWIPKPQ